MEKTDKGLGDHFTQEITKIQV